MMEQSARKSCPDEEKIADYLEGRLSSEEEEKLDAHVAKCELCLEEFMIGSKALREAAELPIVPSTATGAAVRVVTRLPAGVSEKGLKESIAAYGEKISSFFRYSVPWRLRQATIRSTKIAAASDLVIVKKVFRDIETEIEIEKTGEEKAHIRVRVTGREENGIHVTLKKGEREISSQCVNAGYALFEDIPFDKYEIVFRTNGSELGSYLFEIRESRHG